MKKSFFVSLVLLTFVAVPLIAFAAGPLNFKAIIDRLLLLVIWPIFAGASIIMIIVSGFLFVTAQGDPSKISTAKKSLLWAIVGIIVGLLSVVIPWTIFQLIGAQ